jgi:RNA-splicing ligase RtcB
VDEGRVYKSLQSLGGGNHFIEVSKSSETGNYWITIHSGSRNFGKCVAEYHQKVACRPKMSKGSFIEMVKSNYDRKEWEYQMSRYNELHTSSNQPKGSEYLEGEDMYNYLVDAMIAQEYASLNRSCMMKAITDVLCEEYVDYFLSEYIETVHNFIDFRDWIIRKGSIRSYEGERLILPFNMRDGILICEGKTNSEWNCSAPHGAGRVYSRSKAKATLNIKDVERQMKGIFTSCIPLDEAPDAYKDASVIEECIEPTAVIVDRLIPVLNMKCHG